MDRQVDYALNADVSTYVQSMGQAVAVTQQYVDVAGGARGRVANLSQSMVGATQSLLGFNKINTVALDTASSYQKALSNIETTATVTGRSFKQLESTTRGLARSFPVGLAGAVEVVESLQNAGIQSERQIDSLGKSFIKLGAATGTYAPQMGKDFLQLSRNMGNGISQFEALSDSLTTVTKQMGASAPATVAFSKALAPVASTVGMSQTAVMGLSAAMSSLGEDGYRAANVFNKVLLDMHRSVRDGGPELKAYADVMGTTTDRLRDMVKTNPTEMLMQFTESLSKAGPEMQRALEALGFDSVRDTRTLSALSRTDLRKAIDTSTAAYGSGSTAKGAEKAMSGVLDQAELLRETMSQTVQNLGKPLLGLAQTQLSIANKVAGVMEGVTGNEGVQKAGQVAGYAGTLGGIGKTMLEGLTLAALAKGGVNMLQRAGLSSGFRAGRAGATAGTGMPTMDGRVAGGAARVGFGLQSALMAAGMPTLSDAGKQASWLTQRAAAATADVTSRLGTGFYRNILRGGMGEEAIRTPEGKRLLEMQKMAALGRLGRLEEGQVAPTRGELRSAYATYAKGIGAGGLGANVANLGKTAGMIGVDAARFAAGGTYLAGRGIVRGMNALGLTPGMAVAGAAIGAGVFANSQFQEGQSRLETLKDSSGDIYGRFNAFAEATGQAGRGLVAFTQATQQATATLISQNDTMAKALDLTGAETAGANAAGYKQAFTSVAGISDPKQIAAQLQATLGAGAAPEDVARALSDITAQWGSDTAAKVATEIKPFFTGEGKAQDYASLAKAGQSSLFSPSRWFGASDEQVALADMAKTAAQQKAYETGQVYSKTAEVDGVTVSASGIETVKQAEQMFNAARDAMAGKSPNYGDFTAQSRALAELLGATEDQQLASGLRSDWNASQGNTAFLNGTSFQDTLKQLAAAGNDLAKGFLAAQGAGMTNDYQWASGLEENVAQSIEFGKQLETATGVGVGFTDSLYEASNAAVDAGVALRNLPASATKGMGDVGKALTALSQKTDSKNTFAAGKAILDEALRLSGGNAVRAQGMIQQAQATAPTGDSALVEGLSSAIQQLQSGPMAMQQAINPQANRLDVIKQGWTAQQQIQTAPSQMTGALSMQISAGQQAQASAVSDAQSKLMAYGQLQAGIAAASRSAGVQMAAIARDGRLKEQWATEDYQKNTRRARQDYNTQVRQSEFDHNKQLQRMGTEFFRSERYAFEDHGLAKFRAQRDFNTQMSRMERDFNTSQERATRDQNIGLERADRDFKRSQARAEEDYNKGRKRAQEDYDKSIMRATRDFGIQQTQAVEDYNKTRNRAQADYDKQLKRMVEDAAKSLYDPWKRRQAQMVMDAGQLVYNLKDQTKALNQQVSDLAELRGMGLSEQAIKNLSLADAGNAQQVARLLGDAKGNAEFIAQINEQIAAKQNAAEPLVKDAGNTQYARQAEDFATQMARMAEDFAIAQTRSQEAFDRSMADSAVDFGTSMARMTEDYLLAMARSTEDYNIQIADQKADFKKGMADAMADYLKAKGDAQADFDKSMADMEFSYQMARKRALEQYTQQVAYIQEDHQRALARMERAFAKQMKRAGEDFETAIERMRTQTKNALSDVAASLGASIASMKESFANAFEVIGAGELEVATMLDEMYTQLELEGIDIGAADQKMWAWAQAIIKNAELAGAAVDRALGMDQYVPMRPLSSMEDKPDIPAPSLAKPQGEGYVPMAPKVHLPPMEIPGDPVSAMLEMGKAAWDGFIKGVQESASDNPLVYTFEGIVNAVKGFLGIQSPSTLFAEIGRNVMEGLGQGIQELAGSAWEFLTAPIANLDIMGKVAGAWDATSKWLGSLGSTISGLIKTGWEKLTAPIADLDIMGKITGAWTSASGWLSSLGTTIGGLVTGAWDKLTEPLKTIDIKKMVTDAFSTAKAWIQGLAGPMDQEGSVLNWVGTAWDAVWESMPTMETVTKAIKAVFMGEDGESGAKGWLLNLPSWFSGIFNGIKEGIANKFSSGILTPAGKVVDWVIGKFNDFHIPALNRSFDFTGPKSIAGFLNPLSEDFGQTKKYTIQLIDTPRIDFPNIGYGQNGTGTLSGLIPDKWFAEGGIATRQTKAMIAEAGYPEAVIPLNQRGAEVLAAAMRRYVGNDEAKGAMVQPYATPTVNTFNYSYDQSTRFTGPITVKAQDPDAFAAKLEARQRRQRLVQPIGGGR